MKKVVDDIFLRSVKITVIVCLICATALCGCVNKEQNNSETKPAVNITPGNVTLANNASNSQGTGGSEYVYGTATVETIQVLILESFPIQVKVVVQGHLPDSCTEINEVKTKKEENNFNINISTRRSKDAICAQVLVPFNRTISLDVLGLKAGNYTVNVNGVEESFNLTVDNTLKEQSSPIPPGQQVITEADNGKDISLKNGEIFYLKLKENPTTGYYWELDRSQGLNNVSDNYYPPENQENKQPLVGTGGVHIWEIKAVTSGSQQVKGIYKRPWENTTGTEETFTLNVDVV